MEEILSTASYFLDRTQDILETLQVRMAWVEMNKRDVTLEYELIEFASKVAEELKNTVKKIKNACAEFCRRVLLTYNRCQTSAAKRLEVLPEYEMFLKQLQERCNKDEQAI